MRRPGLIWRLFYINYVIARHGLDKIVLSTPFFTPVRFISYFNPWNWFRSAKHNSRGLKIRLALEELGPIFIKFGQILSTRRDLLPEDIIIELEKLQDRVPPFSGIQAQQIIELAYGQPINTFFQQFDLIPLASASIAQVHAATLLNGKQVVVKVVRPNIERIIRRDVALLYIIAKLTEKFWSQGYRLRPLEVVAEFEMNIINELDLLREAANASQLRRNFIGSTNLYVPEVYWEYTRRNVMVMERIAGIPISDIASLNKAGINLKRLAEVGVNIFFTQVFRDSFFHADMHPGNIFVNPLLRDYPQYIAVDFGIVGSLDPLDKRYLAENMLAFFKRDYRRVAQLHIESGWVPANTRLEQFESAIRSVCEPIFEKPLKDISFGQLLMRLFQTASAFKMQVQPQLLLLQKTLLNIEGLGRQLYPDLDLWVTAKPYLEHWMQERYSIKTFIKKIRERSPYWLEKLPEIPDLIYENLQANKIKYVTPQTIIPLERRKPHYTAKGIFLGLGLGFSLVALLSQIVQPNFLSGNAHVSLILGSAAIISFLLSLLN